MKNVKKINLDPDYKQVQRNWFWLLILGIIFVILGTIGLGMAVALTLVSMIFFGILLIIGGFLQIVDVFKCRDWQGALWHTLIAVLYIIAGLMVMSDPFLASTIITAFLATILIVIGVIRFIMALILRHTPGWGWLCIAGIAAIILGAMIFMHWPFSALWVIGLLIAIELIVNGWAYIIIALTIKDTSL